MRRDFSIWVRVFLANNDDTTRQRTKFFWDKNAGVFFLPKSGSVWRLRHRASQSITTLCVIVDKVGVSKRGLVKDTHCASTCKKNCLLIKYGGCGDQGCCKVQRSGSTKSSPSPCGSRRRPCIVFWFTLFCIGCCAGTLLFLCAYCFVTRPS